MKIFVNVNLQMKILYKLGSSGKVQQWQIEQKGDKYRSISGEVGGKLVVNEWTVVAGKNIGRANETSPEVQAEREAEAKIREKQEKGYTDKIDDVEESQVLSPMLAKSFDDYGADIQYPVYTQPKLDGIRCVIKADGMWTRNMKKIVACPHIFSAVHSIVETGVQLDGELYNHKFKDNFNRICQLTKRTKPSSEDLIDSEKYVQFWCYDIIDNHSKFSVRTDKVQKLLNGVSNYIKIVKTRIAKNSEELDTLYGEYTEDGYEGQMIRCDTEYENKRTKNLLKRKEFKDGEWEILAVGEGIGNRAGTAGYMTFRTKEGRDFKSNIKGNHEYMADLLKNKKSIIGQQATIRYFNLTPDLVPRFPYVTAIRNYE